jgi:hypothetical protein
MLDRSRGRSQMKRDTLVLQVGGWALRLTTSYCINEIVQEPDNQPRMDGMNGKSAKISGPQPLPSTFFSLLHSTI